jgi:hypothetical protein
MFRDVYIKSQDFRVLHKLQDPDTKSAARVTKLCRLKDITQAIQFSEHEGDKAVA